MATGTVKWFSDAKGFGFIAADDEPTDVFIHHGGIAADGHRSLADGARASFDVDSDVEGPRAVNVQLAYERDMPTRSRSACRWISSARIRARVADQAIADAGATARHPGRDERFTPRPVASDLTATACTARRARQERAGQRRDDGQAARAACARGEASRDASRGCRSTTAASEDAALLTAPTCGHSHVG
jgi:cold shock protein